MHCPQCQYQQFTIAVACPDCGFTGDFRLLERLSNLNFVLTESGTWGLVRALLQPIQTRYQTQQREVEVSLGLRQPPPTAAEARLLRLELAKLVYLQSAIPQWQGKKWLSAENGRKLLGENQAQINKIRAQLQDAPPIDDAAPTPTKRLMIKWDQLDFARRTIEKLYESGQIATHRYGQALAQIEEKILEVEYQAGMRERPSIQPTWTKTTNEKTRISGTGTVTVEADDIPAQPSRPPRRPWTWERFWESLLSERTLKAILFLGALLLFAATVSWIASNWNNFTPLIQGSFLVSVTAVFFGLGWFVRGC